MRRLIICAGMLGIGLLACAAPGDGEQLVSANTKELPSSGGGAAEEADDANDPALPTGLPSWKAVKAAQVPLMKAVHELEERLGTEPNVRGVEPEGFPGFASIEIDVAKGEVHVYWKGVAPANLTPLLRDVELHHGVRLAVEAAAFSRAELDRERTRVLDEVGKSATITRIGPLGRGEGLLVEVEEPVAQVERLHAFASASSRLAANASVVAGSARAPFVLRRGVAATPMGRMNDTSPFFGGSGLLVVGPAGLTSCSSGFAAVDGSNLSYLLTASHCSGDRANLSVFNGNFSLSVGRIYSVDSFMDSSLVNVAPSSSLGLVFAGGVGVNERTRRVLAFTSNVPGMFVCSSGASSGEICNVRVMSVNQDVNLGGRLVFPMVVALRADLGNAALPGDSGGPVYLPIGANDLFATGTIVGSVSSLLVYAPIWDVLTGQHVHLKTVP